ncbi:MFS general substrate transporter [Peniophora sp. CONT]|nr:MFS general substrate transporter [Peniophora sp. CONT]
MSNIPRRSSSVPGETSSSDAESSRKVASNPDDGFSLANPALVRSAQWKVDVVVIPLVGMYYLLSFLDRSNIGNAKVAGLTEDLHMTSHDFSVALTITYVPYIVMELPMNLLMKRLGPNVTLPVMVTLWGMVTACQGAVTSYGSLLACRFFLGALEGGLFPGITLYLSSFYRRHDMQLRFSMMFSAASLAGAFSGLLAAAIEKMDGDRNLPGWAWIFILEGLFTTIFGLVSFFIIPQSPRTCGFLSQAEREAYVDALSQDWSGDADEDGKEIEVFSWSEVLSAFTDAPHVMLLSLPLFFNGVTLYGLANFTPTIVGAFGYSTTRTQLLTVPPYACSFVLSLLIAWVSDKYKQRGAFAVFSSLLAAAGYTVFIGTGSKHADYGALFLQIIGVYNIAPCIGTWNSNNVQPHFRRATAIAWAFIATNTGGIVSTWLFTDPPRFHIASSINLAFSLAGAVVTFAIIVQLSLANKRKRGELMRLEQEQPNGAWDSRAERRRLGDRHPRFMYTL